MDLTSYVHHLGREFAVAAEAGGEEARALAERLTVSLESAIRLTLLEALSAAADEITTELAPGSVELRLRGRDPDFVVTPPADQPVEEHGADAMPPDAGAGDDGAMARVNFRLPEQLKAAIEQAASREGRSVNAWLVRAASAALHRQDQPERQGKTERRGKRGPQRYTGWVR